MDCGDPHEAIARLEERSDELADRLESCRKFMLASRIAMSAGGIVLAALAAGAIRFEPAWLAAAAAALLGGIVVYGSNGSTAKAAAAEMAAIEAERTTLIDKIEMRLISERPTLH